MYIKEIKLNDNEIASKINLETGEVTPLGNRPNNLPKDKSKLNYQNFGMLNLDISKKLEKYFSNLELAIIFKMINRVEFNSNSLRPFNDETSLRTLSDEFNISKNSVPKIFRKLFEKGVFAQLHISENDKERDYWILNPYIFWKGTLKQDSIFKHFANTDISKLIK
jgi:reverse gyrase